LLALETFSSRLYDTFLAYVSLSSYNLSQHQFRLMLASSSIKNYMINGWSET